MLRYQMIGCLVPDQDSVNWLMIPQGTAAALVSENKGLAYPASVDSIPTSAGQEDHVSMAPIAALKAARIARNAAGVIAVELIAAAQGVGHHAPLKSSARLQAVHAKVRAITPHFTRDRYWADEMAALQARSGGQFGKTFLPDVERENCILGFVSKKLYSMPQSLRPKAISSRVSSKHEPALCMWWQRRSSFD